MARRVFQHDLQRVHRGLCQQGIYQAGQPGRDQIDQIIKQGRRPAKGLMLLCPVANHRISCIDGLIDHQTRQAKQHPPEQGRGNPV